jgi:MFS family permease
LKHSAPGARYRECTLTLVLISASILGFATATTMIGPLLVDLSRELDVPLGQAGVLAAVTSLPWALGAPFTGLLSDRLGRRPLIVLALGGVGAATIAAAFTSTFATLLVARFAAGIFGAFGPASLMAAVGDLFPPQRRGMAMGWLNAGFGLAAVGGVPAVGLVDGLPRLALGIRAYGRDAPRHRDRRSIWISSRQAIGAACEPASDVLRRPGRATARQRAGCELARASDLQRVGAVHTVVSDAQLRIVGGRGGAGAGVRGDWGNRRNERRRMAGRPILEGAHLRDRPGGRWRDRPGAVCNTTGVVASVLLGGAFGLGNATSRPAFLALGSELAPRYRGALLGVLSLTNQGGAVLGSSLGGLAIALGGYPVLALVVASSGLCAAGLAVPLARLTVSDRATSTER